MENTEVEKCLIDTWRMNLISWEIIKEFPQNLTFFCPTVIFTINGDMHLF